MYILLNLGIFKKTFLIRKYIMYQTYVINLINRTEKKKLVQKHLKKYNIKFKFYHPELNNDPKLGCKLSHLHIINEAKKNGYDKILILEDDVKFIKKFKLNNLPNNWDMLYLGGTVFKVLNKDNPKWYKIQCWTTHAYLINLENDDLINDINKCIDSDDEIDKYYLINIHPKYNCYMINPMIAIQREGYSDIEKQYVNYNFMTQTLNGLLIPDYEIDNDNNYILKLPDIKDDDLPKISIITPTYKRRKMFYMAIRNYENFIYPSDKIQWVIVDDTPDTPDEDDSIFDLLPSTDNRIKYIHIKTDKKLTIAAKRNIAIDKSDNDIIIHMDDDDYYPPESLLCRVKLLMKYKNQGIQCLGSTLIGTYNIIVDKSSMSSDGPISLSEASMAYTKKFWEEHKYNNNVEKGEHKEFTENRLNKILDVPYIFILIAITHNQNITNDLRKNVNELKYTNDGKIANYYDMWDIDMQMFINDLRKNIL